jgi:hypothetical protein
VLTEERLAAGDSRGADRPIAFFLRPRRGIEASSDRKRSAPGTPGISQYESKKSRA